MRRSSFLTLGARLDAASRAFGMTISVVGSVVVRWVSIFYRRHALNPPIHNRPELTHDLVVQQAVGSQHISVFDLAFAAGVVRDPSAGLLRDQNSRRSVPGVEVEFPISVVASGGHIAEVEGRRTRAADAVRA